MIDPVSQAISALSAFKKKSSVIANNVANVNTDEFKKSRATFAEGASGGIRVNIQEIDTPGIPKETIRDDEVTEVESSNVDLAEELTEMIPTTIGYKANLKTIKTHQDMLGSLFDIFG